METDTHKEGRQPCEDGGRDWRDATTNQRVLSFAGNHLELEEARRDSPFQPSEGAWPCRQLDLRLLASRTVKE